jgi:hypothetical protein
MSNEPFFRQEGELFVPTAIAQGTWAEDSLHGRAVVGLLGFEIERRLGEPGFLPARLTVDLYRMPPSAPLEIRTRLLRDGRRIRLAEAEVFAAGVSCARALGLFLRMGDPSVRPVWSRGRGNAPPPSEAPASHQHWTIGGVWDFRPVSGFDGAGPRSAWMRELREMVGGHPHTPFSRVAAAADVASPFAHAHGNSGLDYINSDLTIYLHRLPAGEWVGVEAAEHGAAEGVAAGACFLHDEVGPIGLVACAALHSVHPPS